MKENTMNGVPACWRMENDNSVAEVGELRGILAEGTEMAQGLWSFSEGNRKPLKVFCITILFLFWGAKCED